MTALIGNPLVAQRDGTVPWYAGITLVEGIVDLRQAIESKDWLGMSLGGVFTGVDGVVLALDPPAQAASWLVAMCLEKIELLSQPLNWLAGDPPQLTAHAQTWTNVAANNRQVAQELSDAVWTEIVGWTGATADEYRTFAAREVVALQGYAEAADAKSAAVVHSGLAVLAVRTLVRDMISDYVATLMVRLPLWATLEATTLGGATPLIEAEAAALLSRAALRIGRLLDNLTIGLRRLAVLTRRVDELTEQLRARPRGGGIPGAAGRPPVNPKALLVPKRSGYPPLTTKPMEDIYIGETNPAYAKEILGEQSEGVRYLSPAEAEQLRVVVVDGKLYRSDGTLLDTTNSAATNPGGGNAIFVMDDQGNLYISPYQERGEFHHSSILAGNPVAGAGEIIVKDGVIVAIDNFSGHYAPTPEMTQTVLDQLAEQGLDVSQIQVTVA